MPPLTTDQVNRQREEQDLVSVIRPEMYNLSAGENLYTLSLVDYSDTSPTQWGLNYAYELSRGQREDSSFEGIERYFPNLTGGRNMTSRHDKIDDYTQQVRSIQTKGVSGAVAHRLANIEESKSKLELILYIQKWSEVCPYGSPKPDSSVCMSITAEEDFPYYKAACEFQSQFKAKSHKLGMCWLTGEIVDTTHAYSIYPSGFLSDNMPFLEKIFVMLYDIDKYVLKNDRNYQPVRIGRRYYSTEHFERIKPDCKKDEFSGAYIPRGWKHHIQFRGQTRYTECPTTGLEVFYRITGAKSDPTMTGYPRHLAGWNLGAGGRPKNLVLTSNDEEEYDYYLMLSNYSTKAEHIFGFLDVNTPPRQEPEKDKLYFGLEIELEKNPKYPISIATMARTERALLDIGWIMTRDGSLQDGIEFKSAPMTYRYAKEAVDSLYNIIKPLKLVSSSRCGTHCHVSRSYVGEGQVARLLSMIYRRTNADFITGIAGRESGHYQEFKSGQGFTQRSRLHMKAATKLKRVDGKLFCRSNQRFTALNLSNINTVEFRLFAGAETCKDAQRVLQTVKALIDYTKPAATPFNLRETSSYKNFMAWVEDAKNKKDYKLVIEQFKLITKKEDDKCA